MSETKTQNIQGLKMWAKLPGYFRVAAIGVLVLTVLGIGIGFYRSSKDPAFRMIRFPTELSKDVVATVNSYERREMDGEVLKYYIKADKATTFADNHQEMENVYFQVFDSGGQTFDEITAHRAVYFTEEKKNLTDYFAGSVNISTSDSLKVMTEQVTYKKETEVATADEQVVFERLNVRGSSFGATIKVAEKKLELLKDVRIVTTEGNEITSTGTSTIESGNAIYDQFQEKIELRGSMHVVSVSRKPYGEQTIDVRAGRSDVFLSANNEKSRDLMKLELFEDVRIDSRQTDGKPTTIKAQYALYDKPADRFDLKNFVNIMTIEDEKPTIATADAAVYEQAASKIALNGNSQITQGDDLVKGDSILADLFPSRKLKRSIVRGNAYLRQTLPDRSTEITASEMNASFGEDQQFVQANSIGQSIAVLTPANPTEYSKVTMSAPKAIHVLFKGSGLLDKMTTEGRTTIKLDVPDNGTDSTNKQVTADIVKTFFHSDGKNLQKAEAVGNAELLVEPHRAAAENYKTVINAPRFDCDFFLVGNNAKSCLASTKTRTVRTPTAQTPGRGVQTILADRLNAIFSEQTKNIESMNATGNAKFTELDRNAIASQFTFTANDEVVRLRGGEPAAWDSQARAKAGEIDWDTKNRKSFLRRFVSTTYYSQKTTGGSTPFGATDKPVFLTSDNAEFDHSAETAVYTGRARGWQENNYIRAEKIYIRQREAQMSAEGSVQSLLYDAKRNENGKEIDVPVFAASQRMSYDRNSRVLRYEQDVDIRQATDRIVGGISLVYLNEKNEVVRTDVESNVVITQPNRRATGDFAQYITAEERVVLRGNPARVDDAENGSSQGGELTVFLKDNRVTGEGRSKQNPNGRLRSVYKVKNQ
ncbi:MAG: LPS export ABC transporter periplasmic protein LptC [Blastocatellia bacterium]